jgi:hypothetical protein
LKKKNDVKKKKSDQFIDNYYHGNRNYNPEGSHDQTSTPGDHPPNLPFPSTFGQWYANRSENSRFGRRDPGKPSPREPSSIHFVSPA